MTTALDIVDTWRWWLVAGVLGYLVVAVPLAVFVGLFIRVGRGPDPEPPSPDHPEEPDPTCSPIPPSPQPLTASRTP